MYQLSSNLLADIEIAGVAEDIPARLLYAPSHEYCAEDNDGNDTPRLLLMRLNRSDTFKLSFAVSNPIWFLSVCQTKHFLKKYLLKEATS